MRSHYATNSCVTNSRTAGISECRFKIAREESRSQGSQNGSVLGDKTRKV